MSEANLFPVIPYLRVQEANREVTSMSDYVHTGRRSKLAVEHRNIESRLMFGAFYSLFLFRAAVTRLVPWHTRALFRKHGARESIFKEASSAASVIVASSFMGL
jgi:hypothetical protein